MKQKDAAPVGGRYTLQEVVLDKAQKEKNRWIESIGKDFKRMLLPYMPRYLAIVHVPVCSHSVGKRDSVPQKRNFQMNSVFL